MCLIMNECTSVASFGEDSGLASESPRYSILGTYKSCELGQEVYSSEA